MYNLDFISIDEAEKKNTAVFLLQVRIGLHCRKIYLNTVKTLKVLLFSQQQTW